MSLNSIKFYRTQEDAVAPNRATHGDAGADLSACIPGGQIELQPGQRHLVATGIAVAIPVGYVGLLHPRSGLAHKLGLSIVNAPGTIDAGYRGEIFVNIINLGQNPVTIHHGDRIAQLVIQAVELPEFVEVTEREELGDSERGDGGHGSTGV